MPAPRLNRISLALLCLPVAAAVAGGPPPMPKEPELAKLYGPALADLDKISQGRFPSVGSSSAWPCQVDEHQLRLWAGSLGTEEMSDRDRRNARVMNLDVGMAAQEGFLTVRDPKVRMIKAECLNGQLEGELEYAVDYGWERRFGKFVQTGKTEKRVRGVASAGVLAPDALLVTLQRQSGQKTVGLDAETKALMKGRSTDPEHLLSVSARLSAEDGPAVSLTKMQLGGKPVYGGYFVLPTGRGRQEHRLFGDDGLSRVYRYKAGRLHGVQETMPIIVGTVVVLPANKQCFEEGEEIKSVGCDVE